MLDHSDLVCFLTMASTLNFTKTAQTLYVSQQAVSQRISKMEQGLGFPLFLRSRNYVKLTRAGEQLYAFLAPMEQEYQRLLEKCRGEYEELSSVLRIGYQNQLEWGNIIRFADESFAAQNPRVQIIGELHDSYVLLEKLKEGQLHMAILYERFIPSTEGFECRPILETPLLLMVSARKAQGKENASYLDFRSEPFVEDIFGSEPSERCLKRAKKTAALCGLAPSDFILVPNRDTANMAAEVGRGVIVGTQYGYASKSPGVAVYPTPAKERLVCLWKTGEENLMVHAYASLLQKVHASK